MARYKDFNPYQDKFIPVNFSKQIIKGSFEHTINWLVDDHIDMTKFDAHYNNDECGRPAYDPALLLKVILSATPEATIPVEPLLNSVKRILYLWLCLQTHSRTIQPSPVLLLTWVMWFNRYLLKYWWFVMIVGWLVTRCLPLMVARCHQTPPKNGPARIQI